MSFHLLSNTQIKIIYSLTNNYESYLRISQYEARISNLSLHICLYSTHEFVKLEFRNMSVLFQRGQDVRFECF